MEEENAKDMLLADDNDMAIEKETKRVMVT